MAILDWILPKRTAKHLTKYHGPYRLNDSGGLSIFAGQESAAGVAVDEEKAMSLSAVFAAVNFLSRVLSSLPLSVYRRRAGGGKEVATDSRAHYLLHTQPNPEMSAVMMRRVMEFHRLLFGAAIAVADGEMPDGSPEAIWPVEPWRLKPARDQNNNLYFSLDGGQAKIDPSKVIYIPLISYDGVSARSFVEYAIESLGLALGEQTFAAAYFGNGARPGGILKIPGAPDDAKRKAYQESWSRQHGGPANVNRVGILWGGWEWQDGGGSTNPNDAQLLESRRFTTEEVARWFGIPVNFLQDLSRATFSNIEEQGRNLVTYTLQPVAVEYEAEYNRKLCGPDQYTKHNFDALLRGKFGERMTGYRQGFEVGAYSVNDILEFEDRDPVGPMGDVRFVPANVIPIQDALKKPEPAPAPPPPPPPQPAPPAQPEISAEQSANLVQIVRAVVEKQLPAGSARAMMLASFPGIEAATIDGIINPLFAFTAATKAERALNEIAPVINVYVPEQAPPVVNAPVTVNVPEQPAAQISAPVTVNVPEQPAAQISAPVTVNVPEQKPPTVTVNVPEPRPINRRVERDANGDISRVVEE